MPREKWYTVPPAIFPSTLTFRQSTNYFGAEDVLSMCSVPGQDFVAACTSTGSSAYGVQAIPPDGSAATWSWTSTGSSPVYHTGRSSALASDASGNVYWTGRGNTAEYQCWTKLSPAGVEQWFTRGVTDVGGTSTGPGGISVSPDGAVVGSATSASGINLVTLNGSTGAVISTANGDAALTRYAVGILGAGTTYAVAETIYETMQGYDPAALGSASSWTVDYDATSPAEVTSPTDIGYPCTIRPGRLDDSSAWFHRGATSATPYVTKFAASDGAEVAHVAPVADTGLAAGTHVVWDIAVDEFDHLYAVVERTNDSTCDFLRYDPSGVLVYSAVLEGEAANIPADCRSIGVDGAGNVYLGDINGNVAVWSQT